MLKNAVYFFGRLAGATKHDAERAARDAGYRVVNTLGAEVVTVVLGEAEALSAVRARLANEFDAQTREAFESGKLEIVSESEFYRRAMKLVLASQADQEDGVESNAAGVQDDRREGEGHTPAAIAELVGTTVGAIRRWHKRGLLTPIDPNARLPRFSTRQALVARRLVFLFSTGLSEEFVSKRLFSFFERARQDAASQAEPTEEYGGELPLLAFAIPTSSASEASSARKRPIEFADAALNATLSTDGRDVLYVSELGPIDSRGQRRFDFTAFPTDGSFEKPESAQLSEEEEQIALAERLAEWNEETTSATGRPAFLDLFRAEDENAESGEREVEGRTEVKSVVRWCQEGWKLERDGYWEEAERAYRQAALAGAHEPSVCYRIGKLLFLLGDYSAARERFYSALELDGDYIDARVELGKTFAALGELENAKQEFLIAKAARKDDPRLSVELGKLYLRLDDRNAAVEQFRGAIRRIQDERIADDVKRLLDMLTRNV